MCCLFGMIDYGSGLTAQQRNKVVSVLAAESEERGRDAAGIAYNTAGRLHICKRPAPPTSCGFACPLTRKPSWGTLA